MSVGAEAATGETWRPDLSATPAIFDASVSEDAACLAHLRSSGRVWAESNQLTRQLHELVRARTPHEQLTSGGIAAAAGALLDGTPLELYGRWVYFPWSGQLVHLLPPAEFRQLRLDRNRHKITDVDMDRLADFHVGIVGLSVGNAIAVALAMEGVCHLRLADADQLDLSEHEPGARRVHDIGCAKTTLLARQIWEINPYADLALIPEGLTATNAETFLEGLDVVIEECDSLFMKFALREKARARRLPVLMATSDQGLFDVERFDLEPDRPMLHGLAGDLTSHDLSALGSDDPSTRERKAALVLQLLEADRISASLGASLIEIDATVSTWPQLCGDVLLGAASASQAVRALASGSPLPSGRHRVSLNPSSPNLARCGTSEAKPTLGLAHPTRTDAVSTFAREMVGYAVMAPSGGNDQPWHFYSDNERLWVVHDRRRSSNCLDGRDHAALLALGAATENITIAAAARDVDAIVRTFPDGDTAAEIQFVAGGDRKLAILLPLLGERHTNRALGSRQPLTVDSVEDMESAASTHGGRLQIVDRAVELAALADLVGAVDRIRFLCPTTHRDLFAEIRWTDAEAQRSCDGIAMSTLPLDPGSAAAFRLIARADVRDILARHHLGTRLADTTKDAVLSSSAVALLTIPASTPQAWFSGGRSLQRIWLAATRHSIAVQPMGTTPFMFETMADQPRSFTEDQLHELSELQRTFTAVFDPRRGTPAMLMRLSHAARAAERSERLPPEWVLSAGRPPEPAGGATP